MSSNMEEKISFRSAEEHHRAHDHVRQGFTFFDEIHRYEALLIEKALRDAQGSVSHAARALGMKNHQALVFMLNTRHKVLLPMRTQPKSRRQSIIKKKLRRNKFYANTQQAPTPKS